MSAAPAALESVIALARDGRLYPAVILHGGSETSRRAAAVALARTLLCERPPQERPCGVCRHCRRVDLGVEVDPERFHPDFAVLDRDLKTSTSAEATRALLRGAQLLPFEARGQVFVLASADSLTPEARDALLKAIEEPATGAPRHFLLLAPSRSDLPATLRSRSLSVFLGPTELATEEEIEAATGALRSAVERYAADGGAIHLFAAAQALAGSGDAFEDPRAMAPWLVAAGAALRVARGMGAAPEADRGAATRPLRSALLALAEDLLAARDWRLRGISAERILEGVVAHRLAAPGVGPPPRAAAARMRD